MAGYRQFHTKFWKDGWVIDLDPLERYLFSYFFTNEQSSISGIFELPMRIIQNETGLDKEFIIKTMGKFQKAQKIFYKDGILWIVKMRQHHKNASPKTMAKVNADVDMIPECDVKKAYRYYEKTGIYSIDTVSIPIPESVIKDKDKEEDKEEDEAPTPVSFSSDIVAEQIYRAVTQCVTFPSTSRDNDIAAIRTIMSVKGLDRNGAIAYLQPFFKEWKDRHYGTNNTAWLTSWAVSGEIPEKKETSTPTRSLPTAASLGYTRAQ